MARSINAVIDSLHKLKAEAELDLIDPAHVALDKIFLAAEEELYALRHLFFRLEDGGFLNATLANLAKAEVVIGLMNREIGRSLIEVGEDWVDSEFPKMARMGRRMTRANLADVAGVDQDLLRAAMENVTPSEVGVFRVGVKRGYRVMGTTGADISEFMRETLSDAMVEGIPVQALGDADSLFKRLFESGRLKTLKIKGKNGKIITRSVRQRAQAIARVENNRIINEMHRIKSDEVFTSEATFKDAGPVDSVTTDICLRAYAMKPQTRKEWFASDVGLPPRVEKQFHLCRHFLIAVAPQWADKDIEAARGRSLERVDNLKRPKTPPEVEAARE